MTSIAAGRVRPDLAGLAGTDDLREIVGALLTYGLLLAIAMLIISAASWAIASGAGSWHGASRAKMGVIIALLGALLTGGALGWANWLLGIGAHM